MSNIFYDISGDDPTGNSGTGWAEYAYGTSYTTPPNSSSQSYWGWNVLIRDYLVEWATANTNTTLGAVTGGSGYTDGNYTDVTLISEEQYNNPTVQCGKGLKVNITVAGGIVTQVTKVDGGMGYQTNEYVLLADGDTTLGAGAGFKVQIASANSDILIIDNITTANSYSSSTSYLYTIGWLILFNREDAGFHTGYILYWQGNRGYRVYARCVDGYNPQSNYNNNLGEYNLGFTTNTGYVWIPNTWGASGSDTKRFYVSYSITPGEQYFVLNMQQGPSHSYSYEMNLYEFAIGRLVQPAGPDYPSAQTMPPWFMRYWEASSASSSASIGTGPWVMGCTENQSAAVTDLLNQRQVYSLDEGNMLTGMPVFSDAFFLGYTTPAFGYSTSFSNNDQYVQSDGTIWTKRGRTLWIKGAYEYRGNAAP